MTASSDIWIRILEHCSSGFASITPLIGEAMKSSSVYRWKDRLLEKGWLETDGKERYHTTAEGLQQLKAASGEAPKGLSIFYPPLAQVPSPKHKAIIELTIVAVIARKYDLRTDRHPTIIMAGPTLTWKTSTGIFLCYMLGLDPAKQIVNLVAESGRSLWLRKNSTGNIVYKRELLDIPLAVFDEFQSADAECRRLLGIWTDCRKKVAMENQQLTITAVPLILMNPHEGKTLEERLSMNSPQIRRSIICNLNNAKIQNLAMKGEEILNAAKVNSPIELPKTKK